MRVVVLGAGFGGLEVAARLSDEFGDSLDLVLIDHGEAFIFGYKKLDVMFGRETPAGVRHYYHDLVKPGVRFVQADIRAIDPAERRVETDAGDFTADVLVDALAEFPGGRVIVAITSTPFKCPPAPSEAALLMDDLLRALGLREASTISL